VSARQPLFIPLGVGLATDIDDKLLPVGKALEIENAYVFETGNLVKRFGHTSLTRTIQPGATTLPKAWQLAMHKGALVSLSVPGPTPIAAYSPTAGAWTVPDATKNDRRGPVSASLMKLNANSTTGLPSYSAYGAGYHFVLYGDITLGVASALRFDVIDATSGHVVATFPLLPGGGTSFRAWRVAFCNGYGVAIQEDNLGAIRFFAVNAATLATTSTSVAGVGGGGFDGNIFDVLVKDATTISVAVRDGAGNANAVDCVVSTMVTTVWGPRDATNAAIPVDYALCWMADLGGSGLISLGTASAAQGVRVQWNIPTAGATRRAATTSNADPAPPPVGLMVGHTISADATGAWQVLYQSSAATATNNLVMMAIRTGGVLTTGFVLYRSMSLQSQTWTAGGDFFAMFAFRSTTQGNTYVLRIPVATSTPTITPPLAQFGIQATGLLNSATQISSISSTVKTAAILYRRRFDTGGTGTTDLIGIELVTVSHPTTATQSGRAVEAADSLLVPGGTIGQYDGVNFAEMGFAYFVEPASATAAGGGGMTASSTYWYVYLYSYQDAQGRLWRSAISVPQSFATGPGQGTLNHVIPTLRITGRTNVNVEIYRGAAGDFVLFQKVGQVANVINADTVAFGDTTTDLALATGELLYTNGGVLSNDTIPGATFIMVAKNRIWFISADDPTEVWFSNLVTARTGPRFSETNIVRFADEHGALFALGAIDDKVAGIKADGVYAVNGDGPNDAGIGAFTPPQLVALGVGTNNPQSVVSTKDGVLFDSTSAKPGVQMIDRSLSIARNAEGLSFGAAVQRYAGETIVSSIMIPEQSQVRFYCKSGRVLVLDIASGIWGTFKVTLIIDELRCAVAKDGAAILSTNTPVILAEDASGATYTDNANDFGQRVASPWLQVSAIRGCERIREWEGLGRTAGDHTLTLQLFADFNETAPVATKTFTMTTAGKPLWDWEWVPRVQRFGAVKLVILETSQTAGAEINGVTVQFGAKSGLTRRPASARAS
jgi:hypothetical protein